MNGKQDGLEIWWHKNGQKNFGGTYKDGELISEKCYKNEDSTEIDCKEVFGENDFRFADKK